MAENRDAWRCSTRPGPVKPMTMSEMLYGIKAVTTDGAQFIWVPARSSASRRCAGRGRPTCRCGFRDAPEQRRVLATHNQEGARGRDSPSVRSPSPRRRRSTGTRRVRPRSSQRLPKGKLAGISAQREAEVSSVEGGAEGGEVSECDGSAERAARNRRVRSRQRRCSLSARRRRAAEEVRAMLTSFVFFFFLLSSYFVLRPMRDAVAAASGITKLPWLFAGTLTVTLLLNPMFSGLVVRFPVRRVIPISYHFFVAQPRWCSTSCCASCRARKGRRWTCGWGARSSSGPRCSRCSTRRSSGASWPTCSRASRPSGLFGFIGVGGTLGSIIGSAIRPRRWRRRSAPSTAARVGAR